MKAHLCKLGGGAGGSLPKLQISTGLSNDRRLHQRFLQVRLDVVGRIQASCSRYGLINPADKAVLFLRHCELLQRCHGPQINAGFKNSLTCWLRERNSSSVGASGWGDVWYLFSKYLMTRSLMYFRVRRSYTGRFLNHCILRSGHITVKYNKYESNTVH